MSHYSVAEARSRLSHLIDAAVRGEPVTITRHGRPMVTLTPAPVERKRRTPAESLAWLRANRVAPDKPQTPGAVLVRQMRDEGP